MVRFLGVADLITGSSTLNGPISIVSFTVFCDPCPPHLDRHRNNGHHNYNPNAREQRALRELLSTALRDAGHNDLPLFGPVDRPVETHLEFYFKRPASHIRTRKGVQYLKAGAPDFPGTKDVDNMVKFFNDAMETVLFNNDRCVKREQSGEDYLEIGTDHACVNVTYKVIS